MKSSQADLSPKFPLLTDETILKEVNIDFWDAYLTSQRFLLFHDIGFGPKEKILDAKHADFESVEEREDTPWGLYGIAAVFTSLFIIPMILMRQDKLSGLPLMVYFATPLVFLAGIYIVGRAFFKPRNLVVKVKNFHRTVSTPVALKDFFTDLANCK